MFDESDARPGRKQKAEVKKDQTQVARRFVAATGHSFPIFYKGSIIRIGDTEPIEIDPRLFGYDGLAQFKTALDKKHVLEVGA